jgi:hypothetical protein
MGSAPRGCAAHLQAQSREGDAAMRARQASALWLSTAWDGRHRRHGVYGTMEYDAQPRDRHDSPSPIRSADTAAGGPTPCPPWRSPMTDAISPPWKSLLAQPDPDAHVVQLYQGFVRDTCEK